MVQWIETENLWPVLGKLYGRKLSNVPIKFYVFELNRALCFTPESVGRKRFLVSFGSEIVTRNMFHFVNFNRVVNFTLKVLRL